MISIIEHGKKKRFPQYCGACGCIFEVQVEDTIKDNVTNTRVVQCPECTALVICDNVKEDQLNGSK